MKSSLILLLLAAHASAALAQYKCTAANGAVTFQQTPCFGAKAEEKLEVVPNGDPLAASGVKPAPAASGARPTPAASPPPKPAPVAVHTAGQTPDQRRLADYERQRVQHDRLEQDLKTARDERSQRAAQLQQDIAAAQARYGDNPVDSPALKDAIAALNSRYAAMRVIDDDNVGRAEQALAQWDRSPH